MTQRFHSLASSLRKQKQSFEKTSLHICGQCSTTDSNQDLETAQVHYDRLDGLREIMQEVRNLPCMQLSLF